MRTGGSLGKLKELNEKFAALIIEQKMFNIKTKVFELLNQDLSKPRISWDEFEERAQTEQGKTSIEKLMIDEKNQSM